MDDEIPYDEIPWCEWLALLWAFWPLMCMISGQANGLARKLHKMHCKYRGILAVLLVGGPFSASVCFIGRAVFPLCWDEHCACHYARLPRTQR